MIIILKKRRKYEFTDVNVIKNHNLLDRIHTCNLRNVSCFVFFTLEGILRKVLNNSYWYKNLQ